MVGVHLERRDPGNVSKLSVFDIGQELGRRIDDVFIPIAAIADMFDRLVRAPNPVLDILVLGAFTAGFATLLGLPKELA